MADPQKQAPELTANQAIEQYSRIVKENPSDAQAHFNLASAYYVAHEYDQARAEFEQVVRLQDNLYHAHYYLGTLYARAGKLDQARQEWERVVNEADNVILKAQAKTQLGGLFVKN